MNPVIKWATVGAALAFVQYFIFNGAHQHGLANRIGFGVLAIIFYAVIGAAVGLLLNKFKR